MAQTGSAARRKPRFRERNARPEPPRQGPPPPPSSAARGERPISHRRVAALPAVTVEQSLYATFLLIGFAVRIWDVGSRAMHGDEAIHAWFSWNLYTGAGYQYDPVYHGPLQFLVTSVLFFLFGVSNTTARLMAVLFGTGLVFLPYFLRRWMGHVAALLAAAFIAMSPAFVYVSRFERDDIFSAFFAMTMAIAVFQFVQTRRARWFYLGAASIALSLSAMENTYITLFVFGSYVLIVLLSEAIAARPNSTAVRLWRQTGTEEHISSGPLLILTAILILAFALTVLTTLVVPLLLVAGISLILLVNRQTVLRCADSGDAPFLQAVRSVTRTEWINALTIFVAILFLTFSTIGSNLRGIWDATQPLLNNGACPGNTFPLNPCRKDILGGLFYWLSQHQVHRGGQPWFYYSFLFTLYEQIAVVFGIAGIVWTLRKPSFFTTFLVYWAVLMFGIYSWAGEKFAWLMIHPLVPFSLLAAMVIAHGLSAANRLRWATGAALLLLGLLELHGTYVLNFIDGADPVEMMVYVQSAPDTPVIANDILATSYKVTSGKTMHVTIDSLDTWPFAWYLREMPDVGYPDSAQLLTKPFSSNPIIIADASDQPLLAPKLGKHYTGKRYRLRWWFPEHYKTLTWSGFARDLVNPGDWRVVALWLTERRPFGPKHAVWFYYYVKKGIVSPF